MSYQEAMEADGAEVLAYQTFGDYQGTWIAKVKYGGVVGWVSGSYGSCSACDAFESEFGCSYEDEPDYKDRLALFGRSYLQHMMTAEEAIKDAEKDIIDEWDEEDAERRISFIKENSK
jgi:hypothetical protein